MSDTYAVVDADNNVIRVECATSAWVDAWTASNPDSEYRYIPTDVEARDYAGIGFTWDATLERFIPPMPTDEGRWVYDPDEWTWIDLDAPPVPEPEPEPDGEDATQE